ncbi:MAG: hypothetical protein WDA68_10410 [Phycisphaerae bacterium]
MHIAVVMHAVIIKPAITMFFKNAATMAQAKSVPRKKHVVVRRNVVNEHAMITGSARNVIMANANNVFIK